MRRTKFLPVLLIGVMLMLSACGKKVHEVPERTGIKEYYYYVDDLAECLTWVGYSTEELGIPDFYIFEDKTVPVDGYFFDEYFALSRADLEKRDGKMVVTYVVMGSREDYKVCKRNMTRRFGKPVEEDNSSCTFTVERGRIVISDEGERVLVKAYEE